MSRPVREHLVEGAAAGRPYALSVGIHAPAGPAGSLLGKAAGSSLEYMDHRDYQPGDDLRHIDWSVYARSDHLTVKLYRQEVRPHVELLIDGSRSMALRGTDKARCCAGLAAALVVAAENSGFSHSVHLAGERCKRLANDRAAPHAWDGLDFEARTPVIEAVRAAPPAWRPGSIRILLSDLLFAGEPRRLLGPVGEGASATAVIQILAARDADPPAPGNLRLVDSETGTPRELFVDELARRRYVDALARHQDGWRRAAVQVRAPFVTVTAESICSDWDLRPLLVEQILRPA